MNREFLALLGMLLIEATTAGAQISVDPSRTYIERTPNPAMHAPKPVVARPSVSAVLSGAVRECPSNSYVQVGRDRLVCEASFSDVLAAPERFYGMEIYLDGYLVNGKDGLSLLPFTKPEPSPYEIIHIQARPSDNAHKPLIPTRLVPKLANGSWARVAGIFSPADAMEGGVGILTDVRDIVDLSNDPQYRDWSFGTYLPDLRLKRIFAPSAAPPHFEIAPGAH
jgi:hypothetical protein